MRNAELSKIRIKTKELAKTADIHSFKWNIFISTVKTLYKKIYNSKEPAPTSSCTNTQITVLLRARIINTTE